MKKSLQLILFFCLTLCFNKPLFADSPLTSIDFWFIHLDESIVERAQRHGTLDEEVLSYLLNEQNSLEIKISVINAIGWQFKSSPQKSSKLLKAILKKYKVKSIEQLDKANQAPLLAVYSYYLALEDYFEVSKAVLYSQKAAGLDPNSPMIKYVSTLIKSQQYFHKKEWCMVYQCLNELKSIDYFDKNPGKQFLNIALEYVQSYDSYCVDSPTNKKTSNR